MTCQDTCELYPCHPALFVGYVPLLFGSWSLHNLVSGLMASKTSLT